MNRFSLKRVSKDGEALYRCLKIVWRYCYIASFILLCIYFSIVGSHEILHEIPNGENLKYVYLNLFTTRFVTDRATYSYTNWFFVCAAGSVVIGLILCGVCLALGQRAEYKED